MLTSTCSRERNLYISSFSLADRELLFQRLGSRWRSVSTLELSGALTAPSTKKEKRSIAAPSEPLPRESRSESAVKVCHRHRCFVEPGPTLGKPRKLVSHRS